MYSVRHPRNQIKQGWPKKSNEEGSTVRSFQQFSKGEPWSRQQSEITRTVRMIRKDGNHKQSDQLEQDQRKKPDELRAVQIAQHKNYPTSHQWEPEGRQEKYEERTPAVEKRSRSLYDSWERQDPEGSMASRLASTMRSNNSLVREPRTGEKVASCRTVALQDISKPMALQKEGSTFEQVMDILAFPERHITSIQSYIDYPEAESLVVKQFDHCDPNMTSREQTHREKVAACLSLAIQDITQTTCLPREGSTIEKVMDVIAFPERHMSSLLSYVVSPEEETISVKRFDQSNVKEQTHPDSVTAQNKECGNENTFKPLWSAECSPDAAQSTDYNDGDYSSSEEVDETKSVAGSTLVSWISERTVRGAKGRLRKDKVFEPATRDKDEEHRLRRKKYGRPRKQKRAPSYKVATGLDYSEGKEQKKGGRKKILSPNKQQRAPGFEATAKPRSGDGKQHKRRHKTHFLRLRKQKITRTPSCEASRELLLSSTDVGTKSPIPRDKPCENDGTNSRKPKRRTTRPKGFWSIFIA